MNQSGAVCGHPGTEDAEVANECSPESPGGNSPDGTRTVAEYLDDKSEDAHCKLLLCPTNETVEKPDTDKSRLHTTGDCKSDPEVGSCVGTGVTRALVDTDDVVMVEHRCEWGTLMVKNPRETPDPAQRGMRR